MINTASLYLKQTAPANRIPDWSLNLAVERAMVHTRVDKESFQPEFFADTETAQFAPWPIHEHLAFGNDLIPTLIHNIEVSKRNKSCLQKLRSLEHELSIPELCLQALQHNVLKTLTTLIVKGEPDIKLWALACLRAIAGNPNGKTCIANRRLIMRQLCASFTSPNQEICEMVYTIMFQLSENWFVIPLLQKYGCIELVMKTIFTEVRQLTLNDKRIVCLLETLVNLIDYKDGAQKAIRYDLFDLTWLLTCGLRGVEEAMLKILVRVATDEFGRLGIRYKMIGQQLLETFCCTLSEGADPTLVGTVLMLATLPNFERDDYHKMNAIDIVMRTLQEPNLSNPSKLVLVRLLTNLAELPEGRKAMKKHLHTLILSQICNKHVRDSIETLIKITLSER